MAVHKEVFFEVGTGAETILILISKLGSDAECTISKFWITPPLGGGIGMLEGRAVIHRDLSKLED